MGLADLVPPSLLGGGGEEDERWGFEQATQQELAFRAEARDVLGAAMLAKLSRSPSAAGKMAILAQAERGLAGLRRQAQAAAAAAEPSEFQRLHHVEILLADMADTFAPTVLVAPLAEVLLPTAAGVQGMPAGALAENLQAR